MPASIFTDPPRPYDIDDPAELERLLRETVGYAKVSLLNKDGTDLEGRAHAYEALYAAVSRGYRLVAP